jgi:hypothetical protein
MAAASSRSRAAPPLPDGLIEAKRSPEADPEYFVLELATCPEARLLEQVLRDMTLVYLDRRVLPEVLTVMLHPRDSKTIPDRQEVWSGRKWTHWQMRWKVVRLWKLSADSLLGAGDAGLIPWVPLTKFKGRPGPILAECRRQIDERAAPDERENVLAMTQILTRLRSNVPRLLQNSRRISSDDRVSIDPGSPRIGSRSASGSTTATARCTSSGSFTPTHEKPPGVKSVTRPRFALVRTARTGGLARRGSRTT